jgi:hypothetical protein
MPEDVGPENVVVFGGAARPLVVKRDRNTPLNVNASVIGTMTNAEETSERRLRL